MLIGSSVIFRKLFHDSVQQVSGSASVGSRYAPDLAQSQGIELESVVNLLAGIHFVHCQHHRFAASAKHIGYFVVIVSDSSGSLHHKQHKVGLFNGQHHLFAYFLFEDVVGIGCISSGVHHRKFPSAPFCLAVVTISRDSGGFIDYGLTHSDKSVEKR